MDQLRTMTNYRVDADCLELFTLAAQYSTNMSPELLTTKLVTLADEGIASSKNVGVSELTRDQIYKVLAEVLAQAKKENQIRYENHTSTRKLLTLGGIVIAAIGASTLPIVGIVISTELLLGAGSVVTAGGLMAIAASVKKMSFSVDMPGDKKIRFETLNDEYKNPFPKS